MSVLRFARSDGIVACSDVCVTSADLSKDEDGDGMINSSEFATALLRLGFDTSSLQTEDYSMLFAAIDHMGEADGMGDGQYCCWWLY